MTWDQWSEGIEEACPACRGVGVFDSGDKGHGACKLCGGTGAAARDADLDSKDGPESSSEDL